MLEGVRERGQDCQVTFSHSAPLESKTIEESVRHWKIAGKSIEEGVPLEDSTTHLTF